MPRLNTCRSILSLSKIAHQMWHDHPISQRNRTTERTVGVGAEFENMGCSQKGGLAPLSSNVQRLIFLRSQTIFWFFNNCICHQLLELWKVLFHPECSVEILRYSNYCNCHPSCPKFWGLKGSWKWNKLWHHKMVYINSQL